MPAYGREGQGKHFLFWRHISQSEIRNSAAAEKSEPESEGGQRDALRLRRRTGTERTHRALRRARSHPGRGGGGAHLGRFLLPDRGRGHPHACQRTARAQGDETIQDVVDDGKNVDR